VGTEHDMRRWLHNHGYKVALVAAVAYFIVRALV
jgi:hypothetical protein